MRKVIYSVAATLDGYIAGPNGEFDWCFGDQDYGMKAFFASIDTVFLGRKFYEVMLAMGSPGYKGLDNYVFSRTLDPASHESVTIVSEAPSATVDAIRRKPGKHLWLSGGGELFRSFLAEDLVDELMVAVHPLLLGRGLPLLPKLDRRTRLRLQGSETYDTGLVMLRYEVLRA